MPLSMWLVSTCDSAPEILRVLHNCPAINVAGIVVRRSVVSPNELRVFRPHDPWEAALLSGPPVDVLLCAGYPKKISRQVLTHCLLGGFNIHPSLLPLYPGRMPRLQIFGDQYPWAGVSIHRLTDVLDGGPIVLQFRVAMQLSYSIEELIQQEEWLTVLAVTAFANLLMPHRVIASVPQDRWT